MFDCQRIACCACILKCVHFSTFQPLNQTSYYMIPFTLSMPFSYSEFVFFFKLKRYIFSKKTEIPAIQFNMTMFHTICNDSGTRVVTLKSACNAIEKWISVCSIWLMAQILWYCKLAHSIVNMTMLMTFQQVKKNN